MKERLAGAPYPTWRMIPSRFPPINSFDTVASADDLQAVMELEGWTNDRLIVERLSRLPSDQWVFGVPNASIVMAAFLHAAPEGGRFSGPHLGGWYGGFTLPTAIAEVAHHLRREAVARGQPEARRTFRCYSARLTGKSHIDLRGKAASRPELYDPLSYAKSQPFGEAARTAGHDGILYDSLRLAGGVNVIGYRPRQIEEVTQTDHYDLLVPVKGRIVARRLTS